MHQTPLTRGDAMSVSLREKAVTPQVEPQSKAATGSRKQTADAPDRMSDFERDLYTTYGGQYVGPGSVEYPVR